MRIKPSDLEKFNREVGPPPPPVEPRLSPVEEARQIASHDGQRDPVVAARRRRVTALIRRPAAPEGDDAELVALLAAARALPLESDKDRLAARTRLVEIGRLPTPPREVLNLMRKHRLSPGDGEAFADALMPSRKRGVEPFNEGDFGSNYPPS